MRERLSDVEIQRALGKLPGWSRRGDVISKTYQFKTFPEGIAFDGSRFNRTAVTALLFRYLAPVERAESNLASPGGRDGVYEVPAVVWFAA